MRPLKVAPTTRSRSAGRSSLAALADYFKSIESELERLPEADSALVRERLRLAKELVGTLHPLALLKHWKAPDER